MRHTILYRDPSDASFLNFVSSPEGFVITTVLVLFSLTLLCARGFLDTFTITRKFPVANIFASIVVAVIVSYSVARLL